MNRTFEAHINPIFNEFVEIISNQEENDKENVDFDLYLQESTIKRYSSDNENAFCKENIIAFPEEIARQVQRPRIDYKLGFLKDIKYVWLARGTTLYLWDFTNKDSKVFRYDTNQPIEHVDLVTFATHNELLVSTRGYIFLHSITLEERKLQLSPGITVGTDGVVVSDVTTARELKRVFMKGDDGHMYELNLTFDNEMPKDGRLVCHTMNPILRYLSMFFKSPPPANLKSLVVDDANNLLYSLLADSSIHVASIKRFQYLPIISYKGEDLDSIHLVQDTKTPSILAIAKNGKRLFFQNDLFSIKLVHTQQEPPLPGSLLFNSLTEERADLAYYQQGIFASLLSKSERHYLVLTSTSFATMENSVPVLVEDVYHELVEDSVWSIMEEEQPRTKFSLKSTFNAPDRKISTLTTKGVVRYNKQHVADYLESALTSPLPIHMMNFQERYGAIETCYTAHVLACSPRQTPQAIDFIRRSIVQQEGLLLYFTRLVKDIWTVNIKSERVPKDKFFAVQERLQTLVNVYQQHHISAPDVMDLANATIESISLICFANDLNWEEIIAKLGDKFFIREFWQFDTTKEGAALAQNMVFAAIETSKLANASNNYNFIGNFLNSSCSNILGPQTVIYFKGIENLYAAENNTDQNDKNDALKLALEHFKSVVEICDYTRLEQLAHRFSSLGDHDSAIELAFTSYLHECIELLDAQRIILDTIKKAIETNDEKYAINVVTNVLEMNNQERDQYTIYRWLDTHQYHRILTSVEVPSLFHYIQTQKADLREQLILLELYYAHRNEIGKSADTVYRLATEADQVGLPQRVQALKKACEYLPRADGFSKEKCEAIQRKYKVAQVQLEICELLHEQKNPNQKVLSDLTPRLVLEYDLLECAYTQSLYESGLSLMHILDEFNWTFAKTAWENIIESCSANKEQVQSKLNALAKRLYPSVPSFPVYIIYQILKKKCSDFGEDFATTVLVQAGVPSEVVSDAQSATQ